jgi:ankyrin repeat protein
LDLLQQATASGLAEDCFETLLTFTPVKVINMRDKTTGSSLLHYAAIHYQKDLILKILKKGADIMARDNEGRLPLQLALNNKNSKLLFLLSTLHCSLLFH